VETLRFNRLEVEAPGDWTDMSMITLVGPEEDGARASAVISYEALESDIKRYALQQSAAIKKATKGYRIAREEELTLGGDPAYLLEHTFRSPENIPTRQLQLYVAKEGAAYTISITHSDAMFERQRALLLEIAHSLRVR
jgi:hypothetical protein